MSENEYMREIMKKLVEQSEETQRTVVSLDKKVDLHIQKTELQLDQINKLDEQQNRILEEHHQRSNELKRDNELREQSLKLEIQKIDTRLDNKVAKNEIFGLHERVKKLEKPSEFLKSAAKVLVYVGTVAGALYAVYEFLSVYWK